MIGRMIARLRGRRGSESPSADERTAGPASTPLFTPDPEHSADVPGPTSSTAATSSTDSANAAESVDEVRSADAGDSTAPADPVDSHAADAGDSMRTAEVVRVRKVSLPPPPVLETAESASSAVSRAEVSAGELAARLADPGTSFADNPYVSVQERAQPAAPEAPAAPPPPPPVVEFRGVTKAYGSHTAIKDVNFVVEDLHGAGEFVAVLGPSGCGKSTILRLIAGLTPQHPPTAGEVLVGGRHVQGPGADRGMVFQDYTSFDSRSVLDNIAFGLECRGVPKREREAQAREWIEKVGLHVDRDQHKYPHQLSGGMKQRVAIARTLILNPRIILMDEPFGALDPATRLNMQDLLVGLWREASATVFFITHSVEEAVYLADRVYIMSPSPGTILEERAVPRPDFPAREMQRHPDFLATAFEIRDIVETLESSTKGGT